jgi:hypothetical protein
MYVFRGSLAFASLACGLLAIPAWGQGYVTIEGRVGESQAVYAGTITAVTHLDSDYGSRFELTVHVDEVLKGSRIDALKLGIRTVLPFALLQAFARNHTQFLWFVLPKGQGADAGAWVVPGGALAPPLTWNWLRLGREVSERREFSSQEDRGNLFAMDFRVLDTPEKILYVARQSAKETPVVPQSEISGRGAEPQGRQPSAVAEAARQRWIKDRSYYAFLEIVDAELDPYSHPATRMQDVERALGPPACAGPGCYPNFTEWQWLYDTNRQIVAGNHAILTFDELGVLTSIDWVSE